MLYERVKASCASVKLVEEAEKGSLWRICALTEGKSENDAYYPAEVLKNDYRGMQGTNSYLYRLAEGASMVFDHLPSEFLTPFDAPLMGHLIGWFSKPQIEMVDGKVAITAELYIHRSAQPVRNFFLDCWEHGKEIGFSITALTAYSERAIDREPVHWIEKLWFISCDPVSYPAVKGARALKLLESVNKEARKEMDAKVLDQLFLIGQKIAPELKTEIKNRDSGIAFCSHLIETLSAEGFPDAALKAHLVSLRDSLESDNDAEAQKILGLVSSSFEIGKTLSSTVEKLRASLDAGQFVQAKEAIQLCLADADKIEDKAFKEKLLSLKVLLDGNEWEAAKEYLAGIIDMLSKDMYPETYPEPTETYPTPPETPEEVYPLPPETPPTEKILTVLDNSNKEKGSEPKLESTGARITRIELESLLKSSGLPLPAQEKISMRFANAEISREAIQQEVEQEKGYLSSLGLQTAGQETDIERAVRTATNEVKTAFEKELATFREGAERAKTEMGLFHESVSKTQTQEMVRRLVKESFLPAVCAKRVEAMFTNKVATEEEVKTAITAEASLTSEVIASIASTVTGFGDAEPITDEATAKAYVEKFFEARLFL